MQNLDTKKIVITGGSSGIGLATARMLRKAGAEVLITGRDEEKLERVARELNVRHLCFDMADTGNLHGFAEKCIHMMRGVDVLINNAGIGSFALVSDVKISDFQEIFNVNVFGLTLFSQPFIEHFRNSGGGDIVNIASSAAKKGFAYGSVYAASKFALRGLTMCWQAELRQDNIRVILVNPSEVPTAFAQPNREPRANEVGKLTADEIAITIKSTLEMDARGFIPEVDVWATNPNKAAD
jgi:3-oxoacyl-[acyl-carrier protein] reductase